MCERKWKKFWYNFQNIKKNIKENSIMVNMNQYVP
jgi:hypothetical protein